MTISGPAGTYTTPGTETRDESGPYASSALADQHKLVVVIVKPEPGVYTITPVEGSPSIGDLLESHVLPKPDLHVRVAGHGSTRRLVYRMKPYAGHQVRLQFAERANRPALKEYALTISLVVGMTAGQLARLTLG